MYCYLVLVLVLVSALPVLVLKMPVLVSVLVLTLLVLALVLVSELPVLTTRLVIYQKSEPVAYSLNLVVEVQPFLVRCSYFFTSFFGHNPSNDVSGTDSEAEVRTTFV